ncbi:hypothetical protein D3C80_2138670 [compost metagenome]
MSGLRLYGAQLEIAVDSYRHNHGIATDPVELLKHGQTMLGAVPLAICVTHSGRTTVILNMVIGCS